MAAARSPKPTLEELASVEVYGVPEMLKTLGEIDPALRRATIAKMKLAAKPMIEEARSLVPEASPVDNWGTWKGGWDPRLARKGIKVTYKGPTLRNKNLTLFPLLKLVNTSAAGSIVDIAGRANGKGRNSEGEARGRAFYRKISKEMNSDASRIAWKAAERHLSDVQQGVQDAIVEMEDAINKRVKRI
tara:strand:- start:4047 stop:4610 length:564 start_codon:yes stop_codon:yes gene_type:complete